MVADPNELPLKVFVTSTNGHISASYWERAMTVLRHRNGNDPADGSSLTISNLVIDLGCEDISASTYGTVPWNQWTNVVVTTKPSPSDPDKVVACDPCIVRVRGRAQFLAELVRWTDDEASELIVVNLFRNEGEDEDKHQVRTALYVWKFNRGYNYTLAPASC